MVDGIRVPTNLGGGNNVRVTSGIPNPPLPRLKPSQDERGGGAADFTWPWSRSASAGTPASPAEFNTFAAAGVAFAAGIVLVLFLRRV